MGTNQYTPITNIESYQSGESVKDPQPGDFILVHSNSFFDKLIQYGQSLRFVNKDTKYVEWNHAAIIVNDKGDLIEATGKGITMGNISDYKDCTYTVVRIQADDEDRKEAVNFAWSRLGESYGWITIASIAISLITGLKFSFGFDGQEVCSGLVARCLERTSAIFDRDASHITPADLAKMYQVNLVTS